MHPRAAVAIAALALACGARAEAPPDVLGEYRRAIASRRWADAYHLMSAEFRKETSLAEFQRALEENPREVQDTLAASPRAGADADVEARVHYGLGEEIAFSLEDGRWVIDTPVT